MQKRILGLGVGIALTITLPANAGLHSFASDDSVVVGTSGFLNDEEIGWFDEVGHSITESFVDPLPEVTSATFMLSVVSNTLSSHTVNWFVLINGVNIGEFSVAPGFTGDIVFESLDFAPIASNGGLYEVRFEVNNNPPFFEFGRHTLAYAGDYLHQVELIPAPSAMALLGLFGLVRSRRRRI